MKILKKSNKILSRSDIIIREIVMNIILLLNAIFLTIIAAGVFYTINNPSDLIADKEINNNDTIIEVSFAEEKPYDMSDLTNLRPEYLTTLADRRNVINQQGITALKQQTGLEAGYSFEGYGDSKYDATATSRVQLLNLKEHRKLEFELDLKNFSIKFFLCSFMFLVIGRYIYIRKKPADDKFHEVKSTLNKDIIE